MSDLEKYLKKVKERCDAATEGPWCWRVFGTEQTLVQDTGPRKVIISGGYTRNDKGVLDPMSDGMPVSDFIAHARTDVPRLLEIIDFLMTYNINMTGEEPLNKIARGDI